MKIVCWNVNGVRAAVKKGMLEFLERENPDIFCIQESKAKPKQLSEEVLNPSGYYSVWNSAERPGYSGVAIFSKKKPIRTELSMGVQEFDHEGRFILTEFEDFVLMNLYFPNGGMGDHRVKYKLDFYDQLLDIAERLRKEGKNLIICGDYNTAHKEIDLARPKENEGISGFLPIERAWLDKFVSYGYVDTFRNFYPELTDAYTWWSMRTYARPRNIGWRIDYFFVNKEFLSRVDDSYILTEIEGSDHAPIVLKLK
ncbi:MAG: exodeoxyribonuclease III [Patescibacteria group bacterium]